MECYLIKKRYRNKNELEKHYQEAKLFFVFKNYKFKGCPKKQITILEITMLFPSSKLIILTNKNRLIRTIKEKHYTSSLKYMTFSQFDTLLNSRKKDMDIVELKRIKISIKEEEVSNIFKELFVKSKLVIDKNNKEINITDLPEYYYEQIKEETKYFSFRWIMKNYEKQFAVDSFDIRFI